LSIFTFNIEQAEQPIERKKDIPVVVACLHEKLQLKFGLLFLRFRDSTALYSAKAMAALFRPCE
jgi:hypothetical protein